MIDNTPLRTTTYNTPPLPAQEDPAWIEVAVRSRLAASAELRSVPAPHAGALLMTVYTGDVIHVMRDVRCGEHWIAAKVGYKVGWLDVSCIAMAKIRQRSQPEPVREMGFNEWLDTATEQSIPQEFLALQTQEMQSVTAQPDTPLVDSKDVNRIISRLKAFGRKRH